MRLDKNPILYAFPYHPLNRGRKIGKFVVKAKFMVGIKLCYRIFSL
jgi:hypothetical protein